jgi:Flp pilus assembly protein CpaB
MHPRRHPLGIRARWWWHRHPIGGWGLSVVLVAALVASPGFVGATRPPGSETPAAVVAATDLPIGHRIRAGDLTTRPVDAIGGTPVEDPVGRVVTALVLGGEPLVAERLAPAGADGAAALVPAGEVAVAVPIAVAAPPVVVGDDVEVFVTDGDGFTTATVARDALVVAVGDDAVTVSMEPAEAATVADGLAAGAVTLGLLGPPR